MEELTTQSESDEARRVRIFEIIERRLNVTRILTEAQIVPLPPKSPETNLPDAA